MRADLVLSLLVALTGPPAPVGAPIALPGGPPVGMDYLTADRVQGKIWVPAGNTGNVDVVDVATRRVTAVGGFPTAAATRPDRPRRGPSSAAVADGEVWIGDRADGSVCAVDARTLARGRCIRLPSMPDGVAYVAAAHELWVTTPRDRSITVVDLSGRSPAAPLVTIKLEGDPEGLAVDAARGIFYTNLEDKDRTLAISVRDRKVVDSWPSGCGSEGARGLAIDPDRRLLFDACTDGAVAQDLGRHGKLVGRLKTGGGVDNIDYAAGPGLLLVASGRDATLTTARVAPTGALTSVATAPTAAGARCVVAAADGTAYVADSAGGRLIVVKPPR
ncbi:MAG TPA: PQQ-binding-like beta-propeller repeat protein [Polyangia bacterium]|nr:PQQ-binding-like beta-propeller repeat protein [Polyangia bacterium]